MKRALILPGGGFKGAFQVGALREIRRQGITFDYISGISTGALQGLLVAMDAPDELERLWQRVADEGPGVIYTSDLLDQKEGVASISVEKIYQQIKPKMSLKLIFQLLSEKGRLAVIGDVVARINAIEAFAENSPLLNILSGLTASHPVVRHYQAGCVSLFDGSYYCKSRDDFPDTFQFAQFVKASASMPLVWPATSVTDNDGILPHLIDGGIRNISPLGDAIRYINAQDDQEKWIFYIINNQFGPVAQVPHVKWNLLQTAGRSLDILLNEVFQGDVDQFMTVNDLVAQGLAKGITLMRGDRPLRYFDSVIIDPTVSLGGTLDASKKSILARIAHGVERAAVVLSTKAANSV